MLRYTLTRLTALIPVVLGVVILVSLMAHAIPGDPVELLLGDMASEEDREILRADLNLNQSIHMQIFDYFKGIVNGDLGNSLLKQESVTMLILERYPATLKLALVSMVVALLLSIPLGMIAAVFSGTIIDFGAMFFAMLGVAMPNFWLGAVLVIFFSLQLNWLPVSGNESLSHYILPAITLGTAFAAVLSRMTRNGILETLKEDYIRTAKAKGCSTSRILFRHALKNASLPLITIAGLQFGVILTGAVVTEVIFDWPGLGTLMLDAVRSRDYPLMQGCVLIFSASYLIVNLLTDLMYAWVDPRIKL